MLETLLINADNVQQVMVMAPISRERQSLC